MLHRGKLPRNKDVLLRMLDELTAFVRYGAVVMAEGKAERPAPVLVLSVNYVWSEHDPNDPETWFQADPRGMQIDRYITRCGWLIRAIVARLDDQGPEYDEAKPETAEQERNRFVFEEYAKPDRTTEKEIRMTVNSNPAWPPLKDENATRRARKAHAELLGKTEPKRAYRKSSRSS